MPVPQLVKIVVSGPVAKPSMSIIKSMPHYSRNSDKSVRSLANNKFKQHVRQKHQIFLPKIVLIDSDYLLQWRSL